MTNNNGVTQAKIFISKFFMLGFEIVRKIEYKKEINAQSGILKTQSTYLYLQKTNQT